MENEVALFQTGLLMRLDKKSRKFSTLVKTIETIFKDLVDEFGNK
jgi:hypothetical protein